MGYCCFIRQPVTFFQKQKPLTEVVTFDLLLYYINQYNFALNTSADVIPYKSISFLARHRLNRLSLPGRLPVCWGVCH
jgi:hypothetical protein